jgi:hypothetical protein
VLVLHQLLARRVSRENHAHQLGMDAGTTPGPPIEPELCQRALEHSKQPTLHPPGDSQMKLTVCSGEKFATLLPRAVSQKGRSSASSSFTFFVANLFFADFTVFLFFVSYCPMGVASQGGPHLLSTPFDRTGR